jgi:hypothetical protein
MREGLRKGGIFAGCGAEAPPAVQKPETGDWRPYAGGTRGFGAPVFGSLEARIPIVTTHEDSAAAEGVPRFLFLDRELSDQD